jgi:hypothetical protein
MEFKKEDWALIEVLRALLASRPNGPMNPATKKTVKELIQQLKKDIDRTS